MLYIGLENYGNTTLTTPAIKYAQTLTVPYFIIIMPRVNKQHNTLHAFTIIYRRKYTAI